MKCLITGCPSKKLYCRGLCRPHYCMIEKIVATKKRTWEDFEKAGMILKAQTGRNTESAGLFKKMIKKKFPK